MRSQAESWHVKKKKEKKENNVHNFVLYMPVSFM